MELSPQQKKKLERLAKVVDNGNLGVFEHLVELEDKVDELLPDVKKIVEQVKGEKGDNYELTDDDRREIAKATRSLIDDNELVDRILNLIDIPYQEIAKEASKFIKVREPKEIDIDEVAQKASELVELSKVDETRIALEASKLTVDEIKPLIPTIEQVADNVPILGEKVRDALELIPEEEDKLSIDAVGYLREELKKRNLPTYIGGVTQEKVRMMIEEAEITPGGVSGDIQYNNAGELGGITSVATGNALISAGVNTVPTWGKIGLTTHVSGLLPFANIADGSALSVLGRASNSSGVMASITAGSDGQVLRRSGTTLGFGGITMTTAGSWSGLTAGRIYFANSVSTAFTSSSGFAMNSGQTLLTTPNIQVVAAGLPQAFYGNVTVISDTQSSFAFRKSNGQAFIFGQDVSDNGGHNFFIYDHNPSGTDATVFYVDENHNVVIGDSLTSEAIDKFNVLADQTAGATDLSGTFNYAPAGTPLITGVLNFNFSIYTYNSTTLAYAGTVSLDIGSNDGNSCDVDVSWTGIGAGYNYIIYWIEADQYIDVGTATSYTLTGDDSLSGGAPTASPAERLGIAIRADGGITASQPSKFDDITPNTNDGASLGTTALQWSDLFLAEGAVINFDNGDVTITQTANVLAFAGASDRYTFDSRVSLASVAGSTTAGDIWQDSTQKAIQTYVDGIEQTLVGTLFTQTATATVANTVTETALTSTGVGTLTLPASFFVAGKTIRLRMWGYHSSTGNPTITVRIKLGSTTILTMTGSSGNGSNDTFQVFGDITCRTTGGSGTVFGQGLFEEVHGSGLRAGSDNTATTTVDTTASQAVSVTVQWGTADAGNTISATNFTLEALN